MTIAKIVSSLEAAAIDYLEGGKALEQALEDARSADNHQGKQGHKTTTKGTVETREGIDPRDQL